MKPYAYAVVQGEDDRENVSLQFDHPEMCGQKYRQAIPLFTHPSELTDEEIENILRESIWALGLNTDWAEEENWNDAITVYKSTMRKAQSNCNGFCGEYECKENKGGCKRNEPTVVSYTHPVKELTDEEITEVFRDCTKDGILDANDFAKAILRKASEK